MLGKKSRKSVRIIPPIKNSLLYKKKHFQRKQDKKQKTGTHSEKPAKENQLKETGTHQEKPAKEYQPKKTGTLPENPGQRNKKHAYQKNICNRNPQISDIGCNYDNTHIEKSQKKPFDKK